MGSMRRRIVSLEHHGVRHWKDDLATRALSNQAWMPFACTSTTVSTLDFRKCTAVQIWPTLAKTSQPVILFWAAHDAACEGPRETSESLSRNRQHFGSFRRRALGQQHRRDGQSALSVGDLRWIGRLLEDQVNAGYRARRAVAKTLHVFTRRF